MDFKKLGICKELVDILKKNGISAPTPIQEEIKESPVSRDESEIKSEAPIEKAAPVRYVTKVADISFRHPVDPNITKRIQDIIVTTVKYMGKENVYMKIKASIPDNYMVRLEFVKIPENESELLSVLNGKMKTAPCSKRMKTLNTAPCPPMTVKHPLRQPMHSIPTPSANGLPL